MDAQANLNLIRFRLATSPVVSEVNIVREWVSEDKGFFRARLQLRNGDFLEVSEYYGSQDGSIQTFEYRFQWMDPAKKHLRKRWDSAAHYLDLPGFPHHVHIGSSGEVIAGVPITIPRLIDLL